MTPPASPADPVPVDSLFSFWCRDHLRETASVQRGARGEAAQPGVDADTFAAADVLTVRFADGSVLITAPQDFLAEHGGADAEVVAGADPDLATGAVDPVDPGDRTGLSAASARGGTPSPRRVLLPFELPLAGVAGTRGGGGVVPVEQYRLARLTDPSTLDRLYDFGALFSDTLSQWFGRPEAPGTAVLAAKLCHAYEQAVLDRGVGDGEGRLLAWDLAADAWRPADLPEPTARLRGAARALLLLHGTASSTQGSFGGLWQPREGRVPRDWLALAGGGSGTVVLAWEHRSLTRSPLANLVGLVEALQAAGLPAGCVLDLLSHSRGGLVGELLSAGLAAAPAPAAGLAVAAGAASAPAAADGARDSGHPPEPGAPPPSPREALVRRLAEAYGDEHPDAGQVARVRAALDTVAGAGWCAGTFVRVACPARGTLLADRRTDLFLSLLLRSVGLAFGGPGAPWYELLAGLVRGLVAAKADARALPGLEAMVPGAPLSVALNALDDGPCLPGRLRVVAGDAQAQGVGGLLTLLGDVFYGLHDHDFVVHTHAMFGGLPRQDPRSLRLEEPAVNHFGYFKPEAGSRGLILAALQGRDADFRPLAEDEQRTRGWLQALGRGQASRRPLAESLRAIEQAPPEATAWPIVVVLPGIMGSELSHDAEGRQRVWLSTGALLGGALRALQLGPSPALHATGLMPVAYERLLAHAAERCHVVPWPFDWRLPLFTLGDQLAAVLEGLIALARRRGVALHLLAHSMGGLVARVALFRAVGGRAPLWPALADTGGRLLMLGTPNRGAYAPLQLLLRQHPVASLVGVAASGLSAADLARYGAGFGGLMAMLPDAPDPQFGDLFSPGTWDALVQADARLARPEPAVLRQAADERQWLAQTWPDLRANPRVLYVAGQGATPFGLRRVGGVGGPGLAGSVLRLGLSAEGDGTVPWNATLAPERTWYVPAAHGDLPDHTDAFDAYLELLTQGRTSLISQQRPATRGTAEALGTRAIALRPALPSLPADPTAYVLGVSARAPSAGWLAPIELRVVHGSLDYARFPLLVGHYADDGLVGAVRRVDEKLEGQLGRVMGLKLFTGGDRSSVYLRPRSPDAQPPAYPGAVLLGLGRIGQLTPASLADIVMRGVLRFAFEHMQQDAWVSREGAVSLRLSTLVLGTHVQAISARDSLAGVLLGVWRAHQILAADSALGRRVRIVELEVLEIEGHDALDLAYEVQRLLDRPEWTERYRWPDGTLETRGGALRGYRPGGQGNLWQRLTVREDELGGLKFELIAERARVESSHVQGEVASMKAYVARLCDAGANGQVPAAEQERQGRVLYRMLLPNALKSRLANFERTVFVLDDKAAELPWEMLAPSTGAPEAGETMRPLAVQGGLIRQRLTAEPRPIPGVPPGWDALVVGDPATTGWVDEAGQPVRFGRLPGAQAEARRVRELLDRDLRPWRTQLLAPGAGFEQVRSALLDRPWRILHLAGHGMVKLWVREIGEGDTRRALRRTGMVLSNQQMLSAGDVDQMDQAPELVFINCCYSGRDAAEGLTVGSQLPVLASSLALQFIRMGSKAVVAAGWQVDDGDGLAFAQRFYGALLEGRRFGEAVLEARTEVWRDGQPRSNTWGAYQCYGDPEWRLIDEGPRAQAWDEARADLLRNAARCMTAWELAERVERLVGVAGDGPPGVLLRQLDGLIADLRADPVRRRWLRSSQVRGAVAEAYRALGEYAEALTWTRRGLRTAYSHLQLRHLEHAVNSLSRLTSAPDHPGRHAAREMVRLMDALEAVLANPALGLADEPAQEAATGAESERRCLLGSDALREAFGRADDAERVAPLLDAARHYGDGYADKHRTGDQADRRAYALSNAMSAAGMAGLIDRSSLRAWVRGYRWARVPGPPQARVADWFTETEALLAELRQAGPGGTFWHYTNQLDLLTGRSVLRLAQGEPIDRDDLPLILRLADTALLRAPSPLEADSMVSRFVQLGGLLRSRVPATEAGEGGAGGDAAAVAAPAGRRAARRRPGRAEAAGLAAADDRRLVLATVDEVCRRVARHLGKAR